MLTELIKQLQSLVAGALPFISTKLDLLPFVNPVIIEEMWPATAVLAVISAGVNYNLAQPSHKPTWARYLTIVGLLLAIISFLIMYAITRDVLFADNPYLQDISVRGLFILFFVTIGFVVGWISSLILPPSQIADGTRKAD
jgi:hypothetical protein